MRARMALKYSGIEFEHREIELRNKPQSMLLVSPKGTVPVLCLDGSVIDQSIDIMRWALGQSDPAGWLKVEDSLAQQWIEKNDGPFKLLLDQYKYPNRFPDLQQSETLDSACNLMLEPIEAALQSNSYLLANNLSWVDVAIFPFIRQFSMVDLQKFEELPFPKTKQWLNQFLESELFQSVMQKHPTWMD
jgi:glutathione S-transferase